MNLTKKLRFSDTVLEILKSMDWQDEGKLGVITIALPRELYVQVNKALEAMGGKWNRKSKGHVFENDPRSKVENLLVSKKGINKNVR